ncbi:Leucine Rich Repeat family protein [Dorcoceras hygrometricum]|uniref:Leucine Rich Repeat family protein n=1 Tax=Dorcoceras hygrometricum TaxID=472368 RepID=A0A2Z7CBK5_9LAMI|nr:Leucine Rich Repeat family protein [Dorcoceras hygrometricum]
MKSRKQVSLVGTRSPIKRSWTRIISAIHDPQKAQQSQNFKIDHNGPISNTGPKTSRAARDRPEPNPRRIQPSRHRRSGGATTKSHARRKATHAAATSAALHRHRAPSRGAHRSANIAPQRPASVAQPRPQGATAALQSRDKARHCAAIVGETQRRIQAATSGHLCNPFARGRSHAQPIVVRPVRNVLRGVADKRTSRAHVGAAARGGGRLLKAFDSISNLKRDITSIRSTTRCETPSSACTRRPDEIGADGFSSSSWPEQFSATQGGGGGGGTRAAAAAAYERREGAAAKLRKSHSPKSSSHSQRIELSTVQESRIQYLCDPQWFRDTASRGPTTIVAPESQFQTCPSDHDQARAGLGRISSELNLFVESELICVWNSSELNGFVDRGESVPIASCFEDNDVVANNLGILLYERSLLGAGV